MLSLNNDLGNPLFAFFDIGHALKDQLFRYSRCGLGERAPNAFTKI
jgi:hypothetical protein